MQDNEKFILSQARFEHAEECLVAAKNLMENGHLKSSANRAYYAVFHAMRSVLAFDEIDMKHHSGIISEFRRLYIKSGIFSVEMSQIISVLFDVRTDSDYDDFFDIAPDELQEYVRKSEYFLSEINAYLQKNTE